MRSGPAMLAVLALVLSACTPAAAPSPTAVPPKPAATTAPAAKPAAGQNAEPPANIVEAAKKEGRVVWYTGAGEEDVNEILIKRMKDKYNISLEVVGASGADTMERILAEQRAGRVVGDVFMAGASNRLNLFEQKGYEAGFDFLKEIPNAQFVSRTLPGGLDTPSGTGTEGIYAAATQVNLYGVNVNTNLVPKESWPKVWDDVLKPEFKDKIALISPYAAGPGSSWFQLVLIDKGQAWLEKFAQQNPMVVSRRPEAEAMVARGERALVVPGSSQALASQKGAPITNVFMQDGLYVSVTGAGVIKGAPHPNAAKVLINEILSVEIQRAYAELADTTPSRSDVMPEKEHLRIPSNAKVYPNVDLKRLPDDRKLAEKMFRK